VSGSTGVADAVVVGEAVGLALGEADALALGEAVGLAEAEALEAGLPWPFFCPYSPNLVEGEVSEGRSKGRITPGSPTRPAVGWLWGLHGDALPSRCRTRVERSS
jgi:hypothetical protein